MALRMSLVGFKAQNHKQQVSKRGARLSVDERGTDPALFEMLNRRFGFTLDVAATSDNAKCEEFFSIQSNGLLHDWWGRVWCNPPYSDLGAWVAKAWGEFAAKRVALIVMLVPANRTEQKWWQALVEPYRDGRGLNDLRVEFLPGRPRFTAPGAHSIPPNCRPPLWMRASNLVSNPPFGGDRMTRERAAELIRQTVRQCDHVDGRDYWGDVCEFCALVTAGILGFESGRPE